MSDDTIEITELPIRTWTQNYKESVLEPMLEGSDKQPPLIQYTFQTKNLLFQAYFHLSVLTVPHILYIYYWEFSRDFKEYHTDTTVKFVVKMNAAKLREAEMEGLHKIFKLQTTINISSMVCNLAEIQ